MGNVARLNKSGDNEAQNDEYPMHPLFAHVPRKGPLTDEIGTIDVRRVKAGKSAFIAWVPADEIMSETDILDRWGPGEYELVARNSDRSRIVIRGFQNIGEIDDLEIEGETDEKPKKAEPFVDILRETQLRAEREIAAARERESQMLSLVMQSFQANAQLQAQTHATMMQSQRESNAAIMQAVTALANARMADQREIVQALAGQQGQQQGAADPNRVFEMMSEAFATGLATGEERAAQGDDSAVLNNIVSAVMQGAAAAQQNGQGGGTP